MISVMWEFGLVFYVFLFIGERRMDLPPTSFLLNGEKICCQWCGNDSFLVGMHQ